MALEESDQGELTSFQTRFAAMLTGIDVELQQRFAAYDSTKSRDELAAIRTILNRRRYIDNLVQKIDTALT